MSDNELKKELKILIFDESKDEQEASEDGFRIGILSNEEILQEVVSLIEYYKQKDDD
jgi:hypothetical protein